MFSQNGSWPSLCVGGGLAVLRSSCTWAGGGKNTVQPCRFLLLPIALWPAGRAWHGSPRGQPHPEGRMLDGKSWLFFKEGAVGYIPAHCVGRSRWLLPASLTPTQGDGPHCCLGCLLLPPRVHPKGSSALPTAQQRVGRRVPSPVLGTEYVSGG